VPVLDELGWNAELASAFEQLQDDNLFPARIAAQHRGEFHCSPRRARYEHVLPDASSTRTRWAGNCLLSGTGSR
jgi:hypothetical protein